MENKFRVLAQEKYLSFLVWQNAQLLWVYGVLALVFSLVLWPFISELRIFFSLPRSRSILVWAFLGALLIHSFFVLRLVDTRPYFLSEAARNLLSV